MYSDNIIVDYDRFLCGFLLLGGGLPDCDLRRFATAADYHGGRILDRVVLRWLLAKVILVVTTVQLLWSFLFYLLLLVHHEIHGNFLFLRDLRLSAAVENCFFSFF